jgi:hypothetical protein
MGGLYDGDDVFLRKVERESTPFAQVADENQLSSGRLKPWNELWDIIETRRFFGSWHEGMAFVKRSVDKRDSGVWSRLAFPTHRPQNSLTVWV